MITVLLFLAEEVGTLVQFQSVCSLTKLLIFVLQLICPIPTGNEQAEDLGEVQGTSQEYKDYNIKLWCFDTVLTMNKILLFHNGSELSEYKVTGGGGTDFNANWEYMKENDILPKRFIMFTDGYPWDSWGDDNYCDTVFVIRPNHDKNLQAPICIHLTL